MDLSITFMVVFTIIYLIGTFLGLWKIFEKAGFAGWKSIVPVYNMIVWLRVLERPMWWLIFIAIPYLSIFMFFLMVWKTIRRFGKTSYLVLIPATCFPCLYFPYLGFSRREVFHKVAEMPKLEIGLFSSRQISGREAGESPEGKKTKAREWCDAIIYAVVAAHIIRTFMFEFYKIPTSSMESTLMVGDFLCVSKMAYGPRVPQTFIQFPFVHHTLPLCKYHKSYTDIVRLPYMRMPGYRPLQRNDAVVFNYPDGDTVILQRQNESYYGVLRALERAYRHPRAHAGDYYMCEGEWHTYAELFNKYGWDNHPGKAREVLAAEFDVVYRPSDKRENYIKRCVGVPGDELRIVDGVLYVNGKKAYKPEKQQFLYQVNHNGVGLNQTVRQRLDINEEDYHSGITADIGCLHAAQVNAIRSMRNVIGVECLLDTAGYADPDIFPYDPRYPWNKDNFGPLRIPKMGETVQLDDSTICLYRRIIKNYEGHDLQERDGKIFIDGVEAHQYTFAQNYYWMMGDNRHNSADSRFWGFVPEDHIAGRAAFVWLSLDKFKKLGDGKIRWKRMYKKIH